MAEFLGCLGPDWADHRLQGGTLKTRTGWTFEATAGGDAAPQTAYWLENDSAAGDYIIGEAAAMTADTYVWYMVRGFKLRATSLTAADEAPLLVFPTAAGATLNWLQDTDSSHYVLQLVLAGVDSPGSTSIAVGDTITIMVEFNGTNVKLWINNDGSGTPELTVTSTIKPNAKTVSLGNASDGNTPFHDFSGVVWHMSDSEGDKRDPTGIEVHMLEGTSDGTDGDYSSDDANAAVFGDVDLDGSDQVDDTPHWLILGANAGAQSADTTDPAESGVVIGANMRFVHRTNLVTKTVDTYIVVRDNTNSEEIQLANIDSTTFIGHVIRMPLAPDSGAWSAYDLANVELGVRSVDTNTANDYMAGILLEVASAALSPGVAGPSLQVNQAVERASLF